MTAKQESLYWRLWNAACIEQGWTKLGGEERNAKRHAAHVNALGRDKSHKAFTNSDCDKVFRTFKVLADPNNIGKEMDLAKHVDENKGDRDRLLYRIRMIMPEEYTRALMREKFGTERFEDLDLTQLDQLCITLIERKKARARRELITTVTTTKDPALL